MFVRGVSAGYDALRPSVHQMRLDRRPKDSSLRFHEIADDWFYAKFGIRYRSQSLMTTSRVLTAQAYAASTAHVMRVLPLAEYRYCWSPNAMDLLFLAKQLVDAPKEEVVESLEKLDYRENDLHEAHLSGCEVMLHCSTYVTIPLNLLGIPAQGVFQESGILLPPP